MRTTGEAVADEIVKLSQHGAIPTPFRVRDFRKYFPSVSENHLNTVLANYEVGGNMVIRRGLRARFNRVGRGLYKPV
jgi:hypothetical protein